MRLVLELAGHFLTMESGRVIDDDDEEIEPTSPAAVKLPIGFQAPEQDDDDDEEDDEEYGPEVDCC